MLKCDKAYRFGETLTQRAGVIYLGIEGELLVGACVGFAIAVGTGNPWAGLVAGALADAVLSLLHAGFGGAVLSIDYTQTWAQEITKGRGLIAVGLVIVARWRPMLVLPICLLFGLAEVAVLRLQAAGAGGSSHLLATLPYVTILVVLVASHVVARRSSGMPADLKAIFT